MALHSEGRACLDITGSPQHPHPANAPGYNELSRMGLVTVLQVRVGKSALTRDFLFQIGSTTIISACNVDK